MADYPKPFLAILAKTFAWEGGVADLEHDHGGLTNMGVTQSTYSTYLGRPATAAEVNAMTKGTAIDVYYKLFWLGQKIPLMPDFLRLEMFNSYTGSTFLGNQVLKALQKLLGCKHIDAKIGPETDAKFRECEKWPSDRKDWLNNAVVKAILYELISICVRDPTQLKWIRGWFNRYSEFFDTVDDPTAAPLTGAPVEPPKVEPAVEPSFWDRVVGVLRK